MKTVTAMVYSGTIMTTKNTDVMLNFTGITVKEIRIKRFAWSSVRNRGHGFVFLPTVMEKHG